MPDWITKDFYWKAFSLLMAIGIWLTVRREAGAQVETPPDLKSNTYDNVPVLAVSANADVQQARIMPQTATVTISGSPEIINQLQRNQIHAFVDVSGMNSAENLPRDIEISLPKGATVIKIDPAQASVTFPKHP
jgi:YbbR domain-containing protein